MVDYGTILGQKSLVLKNKQCGKALPMLRAHAQLVYVALVGMYSAGMLKAKK